MCERGKTAQAGSKSGTREIVAGLFARGQSQAAFSHRLAQCLHASECGRLCERLVKGPGVWQVACVDLEANEQTQLYPALGREDFHCPEGRF